MVAAKTGLVHTAFVFHLLGNRNWHYFEVKIQVASKQTWNADPNDPNTPADCCRTDVCTKRVAIFQFKTSCNLLTAVLVKRCPPGRGQLSRPHVSPTVRSLAIKTVSRLAVGSGKNCTRLNCLKSIKFNRGGDVSRLDLCGCEVCARWSNLVLFLVF